VPNLTPFLLFDGNCAEAMAFYHSCLGGELTLIRICDTPMKDTVAPEHHNKVAHAHLQSGEMEFSATDWLHATRKPTRGNTVALYITAESVSALREMFGALSAGADRELLDELREMPFGTYGHFADQFGVHWFLRCENT
jgi:PhnB protein